MPPHHTHEPHRADRSRIIAFVMLGLGVLLGGGAAIGQAETPPQCHITPGGD